MISAQQLEVRAGARLLMHDVSFRVGPGDKVGLVGRNGAGKTTLTRILAGEGLPASGQVTATGSVGYLPQDPRTGDPEVPVRERILSARGLDAVVRRLRAAEEEMGSDDTAVRERGMRRYERADADLHAGGGYAAEAEAAQIAASLGIEDRLMTQPLRTLSGGQRRRVELARILFSGAETLLLDEPTNHLDADSVIWLREFLKAHKGGLVVISHDTALLEQTVTKVFHLDANRQEIDVYNMGWSAYLAQRETDERRRKRERQNAERKADALLEQASKMRAKATKAQAAHNMMRRAEKMISGIEAERRSDRVARIKFPEPAPCGRTPLTAVRAVEVLRLARGLHRRRPRDRQGLARRRPRSQRRRARPPCCGSSAGSTTPTPARSRRGTGSSSATTPRSTRRSTPRARCWRTCARRRRP